MRFSPVWILAFVGTVVLSQFWTADLTLNSSQNFCGQTGFSHSNRVLFFFHQACYGKAGTGCGAKAEQMESKGTSDGLQPNLIAMASNLVAGVNKHKKCASSDLSCKVFKVTRWRSSQS